MRSPLRRPRKSALVQARFEDERGNQLRMEIPREPEAKAKAAPGPIAKARAQVKRREGESRAAWKNRVFNHLRANPDK